MSSSCIGDSPLQVKKKKKKKGSQTQKSERVKQRIIEKRNLQTEFYSPAINVIA